MQRCEDNVAARLNGNALQPLSGVSITVTDDATGLPATLYSDNGVTQIIPPLVTDDNGYYGFYAANGEYTLTFTGVRIATFTRKVVLADPSDNPYASKGELAAPTGASLIGSTGGGSVADALVTLAKATWVRPQIVATRGRIPINVEGGPSANYTRFESYLWVRTGPRPVNSLQVVYCNRSTIGGGENWTNASDYQLESAIFYAGQVVPVTFGGAKNPTLAQGATLVLSEKSGMNLPANASLQVRSAALTTAGQKVPVGQPASLQFGAYSSTASASQVYVSTAMAIPSGGALSTYGFVPLAIIGVPDQRHVAVMLWGDSITYGSGDTANGETTYGHVGWAERGLVGAAGGVNVPFVNVSRSGDSTNTWAAGAAAYQGTRWALLEYATHAVFAMGTNDISAGRTLAQLQANCQAAWASAKRMGVKAYQTTITPKTTSTDSWVTLANQTVNAGYGATEIRGQFNAWLASQVSAGNLNGVIDLNTAVCDPANTDKWAVNGTANYLTADGLHPSTAGHVLMATVFNALVAGWTVN